jgi:hypothetical protein
LLLEGIYERTGLCPYTGECNSFQTIVKNERWLGKALSRIRRQGLSYLPEEEGGYSEEALVDKLEQLRRVKERCYSYNGRCLRFWQFEKRKEEFKPFELIKRLEVLERITVPIPLEDRVQNKNE